jgi:hypothetical protein
MISSIYGVGAYDLPVYFPLRDMLALFVYFIYKLSWILYFFLFILRPGMEILNLENYYDLITSWHG